MFTLPAVIRTLGFALLMVLALMGFSCKPAAAPATPPKPTPEALPESNRSDDDLFGDSTSDDSEDDASEEEDDEDDEDEDEDEDEDDEDEDEDDEEEKLKDILNSDDELTRKVEKERRNQAMIRTLSSLPAAFMGLAQGSPQGLIQSLAYGAEGVSPGGGALVGAGANLFSVTQQLAARSQAQQQGRLGQ